MAAHADRRREAAARHECGTRLAQGVDPASEYDPNAKLEIAVRRSSMHN